MENENLQKHIPALEALLFIYGAPMSHAKAAKSLEISTKELVAVAEALSAQLAERGSGLMLLSRDSKLQLVTRPDFSEVIETVIRSGLTGPLSPALIETLTIVAYSGPISRAEIDFIRGVNSSFALRSLLLRGLIMRTQHEQAAYVYEVSTDALKHFGVSDVSELPDYTVYSGIMKRASDSLTHEEE